METEVYVSTDLNEVKAVLEGKCPNSKELIKDYTFMGEGIVHLKGLDLKIRNISCEDGKSIQKNNCLKFNPTSKVYIPENIAISKVKDMVKKLVSNGELFVAVSNNGSSTQHFFPAIDGGYRRGTM
jgi:hypothetical protein